MGWPHKEDGTVDWESVFEDKDIGLIGYMERAQTVPALAQCAHVIVQSLFIRAQDETARKAFNIAIDELMRTHDSHHARNRILLLLREIKGNRIKYAQHFLDGDDVDDERRRLDHDPVTVLKALHDVSSEP